MFLHNAASGAEDLINFEIQTHGVICECAGRVRATTPYFWYLDAGHLILFNFEVTSFKRHLNALSPVFVQFFSVHIHRVQSFDFSRETTLLACNPIGIMDGR